MYCVATVVAALLVLAVTGTAEAQTPPSTAEKGSYKGLHAAANRGDAAEIRALAASKVNLEERDGHGRTAVHIAAHGGHREALRALAAAGANLKAQDSRRYDIITIAAVRDDVAFVDLAITLGSDPRAITSPYDGTALIAAAHLGHDGVVRSLIKARAPLDHVNNLGWTAVIEAVVLGDGGARHQATLKALVDAGASTSITDRAGQTPLALAKSRGFGAMVAILEAAKR